MTMTATINHQSAIVVSDSDRGMRASAVYRVRMPANAVEPHGAEWTCEISVHLHIDYHQRPPGKPRLEIMPADGVYCTLRNERGKVLPSSYCPPEIDTALDAQRPALLAALDARREEAIASAAVRRDNQSRRRAELEQKQAEEKRQARAEYETWRGRVRQGNRQWYVWVVMCGEDYGYGECYDGLWGDETRVYATRAEAKAHCKHLTKSGDWSDNDDQSPRYYVERVPTLALLHDDHLEDDAIEHLPPLGTRIPAKVRRDVAAYLRGVANGLSCDSAALRGASSAYLPTALWSGHFDDMATVAASTTTVMV